MNLAASRIPTVLMLCAFALACLLHVDRVPLWCTVAAGCNVLWYGLHFSGRRSLPPRWLRVLLTLILLAAVLLSFGTLNGLSAGTALLMVMGSTKLLETRTPRDAVVVTTVALILVLAAGLDRQDLLRFPLYLATGWLALATITALGSVEAAGSAALAFRRAGFAMLLAIPFAAAAFILVPRLPGALWSMPGGDRAQTGLSDEMSPGSISDLAVSDDIAFRVRFANAIPAPAERYWRGPVLHDFDGYTWRNEPGRAGSVRQAVEPVSEPLNYQVMLEPHQRSWLFTLETGVSVSVRRSFVTYDGQFLATAPVTSPLIYQAVSHLQARGGAELATLSRRRDTRLPAGRNPRTVALAQTMRAQASTDADFAARVMDWFGSHGFEYTLTPPRLDLDSADDLIFNTRLGFCGHFASAYVTLMRAAGVPARVVTGYQGGTWNSVGNYLLVRQSDAHAWAEVWLDGRGWTRFDPTSRVQPARLQRGLRDLLPDTRSVAGNLAQNATWLRGLRDAWDAVDNWWGERIVNFNSGSQRALLQWLGLGDIDYRGLALLMLGAAALWAGALLYLMRPWERRARPDELGRLWQRFLLLLGRRGIAIHDHDGPEAIRRRAQQALPHASAAIEAFTASYVRLRFGADASPASGDWRETLARMRQQITAIRRAPRPAPQR